MTRARGYILIPVVMMIAVVAAVAFMLNRQVSIGGAAFGAQREGAKAFASAQAGLAHAAWLAAFFCSQQTLFTLTNTYDWRSPCNQ